MLPDFLIIGAEKAATTWLARSLAEHPAIFVPPEKELFFFSSRFDRGLSWYADHFRGWSGEARVGEATPVYLGDPHAPERIHATLGDIELVASLRHPVDRAYSAYWHNLRHGRLAPDSDFAAALAADACEIRTRGQYARHLARYLRSFPRDRLQILLYDDIRADPAGELRRCLAFLGVETGFRPSTLGLRLNEGGADITTATGPVRRVRSALRALVLAARRRGLVPAAAERRLVAAADGIFRRVARLGGRTRGFRPLDPALREALLGRHYGHELDRLEDLTQMDLARWRTAGWPAAEVAPAVEPLPSGAARSR